MPFVDIVNRGRYRVKVRLASRSSSPGHESGRSSLSLCRHPDIFDTWCGVLSFLDEIGDDVSYETVLAPGLQVSKMFLCPVGARCDAVGSAVCGCSKSSQRVTGAPATREGRFRKTLHWLKSVPEIRQPSL